MDEKTKPTVSNKSDLEKAIEVRWAKFSDAEKKVMLDEMGIQEQLETSKEGEEDARLAFIINTILGKAKSIVKRIRDTNINTQLSEQGQLFLPFLWCTIEAGYDEAERKELREKLAARVILCLKNNQLRNDVHCLLYADFRGCDLSGVFFTGRRLEGADFSKASLFGTSFDNCSLRDANFYQAKGLTAAQLLKASDLYRAYFDVGGFYREPNPLTKEGLLHRYKNNLELEWKVYDSYQKATEDPNDNALLSLVFYLNKMGRLHLSPLSWVSSDKNKIENLLNFKPIFSEAVKNKIGTMLPENKSEKENLLLTGTYYQKRLTTSEWKAFFNPSKHVHRDRQIRDLQNLLTKKDDDVKEIINTCVIILNEIKAEKNWFPSELEKQVQEMLIEAVAKGMEGKVSQPRLLNK